MFFYVEFDFGMNTWVCVELDDRGNPVYAATGGTTTDAMRNCCSISICA